MYPIRSTDPSLCALIGLYPFQADRTMPFEPEKSPTVRSVTLYSVIRSSVTHNAHHIIPRDMGYAIRRSRFQKPVSYELVVTSFVSCVLAATGAVMRVSTPTRSLFGHSAGSARATCGRCPPGRGVLSPRGDTNISLFADRRVRRINDGRRRRVVRGGRRHASPPV